MTAARRCAGKEIIVAVGPGQRTGDLASGIDQQDLEVVDAMLIVHPGREVERRCKLLRDRAAAGKKMPVAAQQVMVSTIDRPGSRAIDAGIVTDYDDVDRQAGTRGALLQLLEPVQRIAADLAAARIGHRQHDRVTLPLPKPRQLAMLVLPVKR